MIREPLSRAVRVVPVLVAALALAACVKVEDRGAPTPGSDASARGTEAAANDRDWTRHLNVAGADLRFDGDAVLVGSQGRQARIAPSGDLTIDGGAVELAPEQRASLIEYHAAARGLRANAIETGRAGATLAKDVVADVIAGLARGDTSRLEDTARAKADDVKRAAGRLCDDLEAIRTAQERVVAGLAEFRPFAGVEAADVTECRRDTAPAVAAADGPAAPVAGTEAPSAR